MSEPRTLWGLRESDGPPLTALVGDGTMSSHFDANGHDGVRRRLAKWLHRLARRIDGPELVVHRPGPDVFARNIRVILESEDPYRFTEPGEDT